MMGKMQNKIKDSKLRQINSYSITSYDDLKVEKGKKTHSVVDTEEVKSFSGARQRKYSEINYDEQGFEAREFRAHSNMPQNSFIASLSSAIGVSSI